MKISIPSCTIAPAGSVAMVTYFCWLSRCDWAWSSLQENKTKFKL